MGLMVASLVAAAGAVVASLVSVASVVLVVGLAGLVGLGGGGRGWGSPARVTELSTGGRPSTALSGPGPAEAV
ncbi:hypothetical protein GCM10010236_76280 [Streptomyces eurythermus]|nr:hypothetical protein GCM10010236_76280 [Streptomyces eurythermus]